MQDFPHDAGASFADSAPRLLDDGLIKILLAAVDGGYMPGQFRQF